MLTEGQALLLLGAVFSIACGGSFFVRTYLCVRDVVPVAFIAGYASSGLVDDYVWRDPVPRSARREYVVSHLFGLTAVGLSTPTRALRRVIASPRTRVDRRWRR